MSVTPARRPRSAPGKTRKRGGRLTQTVGGRRWLILVRQSKKRRDEAGQVTTTSIEVQEAACRRVIAQLDVSPRGIEVVVDHGISGGHGQRRPGRDRVLGLVDAGGIDAVMAYKADRIGRDIEESEHLWNRCVSAGVYVCATDCLDLSDPIYRGVYFGRAQKDIEDRSEYSHAVLDRRRRNHKPPMKTGTAFGMRWKGDLPVPVVREWPIVEETFQRFAAGESMGAIARDFTKRRLHRHRGSVLWDSAAVSRILYCTWYVGLVPDGVNPDGTPRYWDFGTAYVEDELWARVQRRLATNRATRLHGSSSLSGLLFCGLCRGWAPMTLCYSTKRRKDGSERLRHRYRCALCRIDRDLCSGLSIDAERCEALLLPNLASLLNTDDMAERRFARRAVEAAARADTRAQALTERIRKLDAMRQRLLDKWVAGLVPEELYDDRMVEMTSQLDLLRDERTRLGASTTLSADALRELRHSFAQDGPLTEARWFATPAGRRNGFLKLAFPYGLFVLPQRPGAKRGDVLGRLALRHAEDAASAVTRRLAVRATGLPV
jgi:DNA invertase Pin-like site-specific DNA recombinase